MDDELLTEEERARAQTVLEAHPYWSPDGYVRFWDSGTVQLDGEFDLEELETLIEIMRAVQNRRDK